MEFYLHTLPNGIRCVHRRTKSPVAYCALTINAGSRDELEPEYGMAHFTEHMMFKGTRRRRAHHIANRLEKLGGELNAFTTKEDTVIHATTLKTDVGKALELISDVVFNSTYPSGELDKEKQVVMDEINSYKDSPSERIYDEFEDMLFAGSSLGHNILGTRSKLRKFDTDAINSFTSRCYTTDSMVLSMAGNFSEKYFHSLAGKYFMGVPASGRGFQRDGQQVCAPFTKIINRRTHQAHCILGGRAYGFHEKQRSALSLLMNYIGGPAANSVLNIVLRERSGLTYNVEAAYTPYSDTGIASIYFGTDKDKVERCLEIVAEELKGLQHKSLSGSRLSAIKKQFLGQVLIAMESTEGYILNAGKSLLLFNDIDSLEKMYEKVMSVTSTDIMDAANYVFGSHSCLIYK